MLLRITRYADVDKRKLMEVYCQSNYENAACLYPDEGDQAEAVKKVEAAFLGFLQKDFFPRDGSTYWILEDNGIRVSGLRTCRIQPSLYYLEALETRPDLRERGYASKLLTNVLQALEKEGASQLWDCVRKTNAASLRTHKKCGFQIVSEAGYDYLRQESDRRNYGLAFRFS